MFFSGKCDNVAGSSNHPSEDLRSNRRIGRLSVSSNARASTRKRQSTLSVVYMHVRSKGLIASQGLTFSIISTAVLDSSQRCSCNAFFHHRPSTRMCVQWYEATETMCLFINDIKIADCRLASLRLQNNRLARVSQGFSGVIGCQLTGDKHADKTKFRFIVAQSIEGRYPTIHSSRIPQRIARDWRQSTAMVVLPRRCQRCSSFGLAGSQMDFDRLQVLLKPTHSTSGRKHDKSGNENREVVQLLQII